MSLLSYCFVSTFWAGNFYLVISLRYTQNGFTDFAFKISVCFSFFPHLFIQRNLLNKFVLYAIVLIKFFPPFIDVLGKHTNTNENNEKC